MSNFNLDIIFETLAGSHLYGTNIADSDNDYRGVCLQPWQSLLGLQGFAQIESKNPDRCIYGTNKFLALAAQCNPNIIELLFAPIEGATVIVCKPEWLQIYERRNLFVSKAAASRFAGYAYQQFHRMKTHHAWMTGNNPPNVTVEDFGGVLKPDGGVQWPNAGMQSAYANAHHQWNQYQTWLANRNQRRSALEQQFGYDTKYAMHLVRLIQEGEELLLTGNITVPRPNASDLLKIRAGTWTYAEVEDYALTGIERLKQLEQASPLPWGADHSAIENLAVTLNMLTITAFQKGSHHESR